MTELNSYSIENNLKTSEAGAQSLQFSNTKSLEDCNQVPVVHYTRIDSKVILQNMEEVLDTVKKQHKEKHRRKKELKKLAIGNETNKVLFSEEKSKDKKKEQFERKHKHKDKEKRHLNKNPLQEKSAVDNGTIFLESPAKSSSILQHFPRTPKKEEAAALRDEVKVELVCVENEKTEKGLTSKTEKVTNAFEVMMNARNKSIGSNTPGKDFSSPVVEKEFSAANTKRKLKLQEWAEQKGASKRRLEDESRAAYVDEQLEQRAKRFKKMLVSGSSSLISPTTVEKTVRNRKAIKNKCIENTQKEELKQRRGPRVQRLSSVDSIDSLEQLTPTKVDPETSEFLSKLNSPTKKRDNLLGYFPKTESPKEQTAKQKSTQLIKRNVETKTEMTKRSSKRVSSNNVSVVSSNEMHQNIKIDVGTPRGRPRRSCTGKARYDYDLEDSPSKLSKQSKNTPTSKTSTRKVDTISSKTDQEEDCVDIILLDDSTNGCESTAQNATPKKLAPLFVRSLPKPSTDPEVLKARKAFLQSGVPEKLRIEQEKQKQYEQHYEEFTEIFPKITHVKQLTESEFEADTKIIVCSLKLNSENSILMSSPPTRKSKGKYGKRPSIVGSLSDIVIQDFQIQKYKRKDLSLDQLPLPSLANKRAIIKNWKTEFERFPTYKCYNQLREKYRYFSAIDSIHDTEQVSESFVVTRQTRRSFDSKNKKESNNPDEEYKPPATAPNGELLFSEKYKPLLFEQVLVNLNPVTQLKEFLSNWSNSGTGSAKNSQTFDDSIDLNDSTCSSQVPLSNTVVLLGPVSSGKTNAVFALANEMNFNVLEINAGMKRTGKRLIQELQEATQSHQIRKDAAGSGSSQKSLLKMSLNGLKTKLKRHNSNSGQLEAQNGDANSCDQQQTARKCLILIEDADIVFDQTDAGFTDAIYTLVASSKRPVIVVASNPNCAHLQRLMSQNTIHFSSPNVLNISKFLAVLSLIENCPVQLDDLISLYLYNRRDLRKTLLELQFFVQSGGDRQRQLVDNKANQENVNTNPNYFASPRKRQFSVEQQESETADSNIPTDNTSTNTTPMDQVYMHRSLFEYYTVGQNSKWRLPFPIDFHLFNVNLNEILKFSNKLKADGIQKTPEAKPTSAKRKSKSPKKQWLTAATAINKKPLDNLCEFYENLSVAALMDEQVNVFHYQNQNKQKLSIVDRLKPNIFETISHCLLEKAIEVNLDAEFCPYNLFDTPKNSISLCEELASMPLRSNRARNLDYEPALRSICRSEKIRSTLERRSTRFYHYLRNYSINVSTFSTAHFDQACEVFQVVNAEEIQTTTTCSAIYNLLARIQTLDCCVLEEFCSLQTALIHTNLKYGNAFRANWDTEGS